MGMFDKFKNLLQNVDKGEIKEKMASTMDSLKDKVESVKSKAEKQINDSSIPGSALGGFVKKGISKLENAAHSLKENKNESQEIADENIVVEETLIENNIDSADSSEVKVYENESKDLEEEYSDEEDQDVDDEEQEEETENDEDNDEEESEDEESYEEENNDEDYDEEEEEEKSKKQKKGNKKALKNLAKGAMFVGSFLYTQKYENANSSAALLHAFKKTKEVDDLFDKKGGGKSDKKSSKKEKKSSEKPIKSIGHFTYICPKTHRGHNYNIPDIDIPTVNMQGTPYTEEAVAVIAKVLGINEKEAHGIWNGGNNLWWKRTAYTYVNDGKRGMTVKLK